MCENCSSIFEAWRHQRIYCDICRKQRRDASLGTYASSEKGQIYRKRASSKYNSSEKGRIRRKRYASLNPDKIKARNTLTNAVRTGKIVRGSSCEDSALGYCSGRIGADHYLGYEEDHYLDIQWVCARHNVLRWQKAAS